MTEHFSQRSRITIFYSLFATMLVVGAVLCVVGPGLFASAIEASYASPGNASAEYAAYDLGGRAVRLIKTVEELNQATSARHCILFVNCEWNVNVMVARRPFGDFAVWAATNTDYQVITVTLDGHGKGDLWNAIQSLWQKNSISAGGLKTYGGAGRVVWFQKGRVADYAWYFEAPTVDKLKARTKAAFRSTSDS
jgi:hypothetical protein